MVDSAPKNEHNAYVPGYKPAHIRNHTWRTAENSSAYLLPTLRSMVQVKPSLKLLDCGAGPGTISASLAKYMPHGEVTATDLSDEVIQRAAEFAASEGITNMRFQAASIYELPFEAETFDVVHAQQVLCHLDSPLEALQEMLRVCRSGGVVAVRESDLKMWSIYPELPALVEFNKVLCTTMDVAGGTAAMGPRLVGLAMKAGVVRERIQASMGTWCYSTRDEREMWGGVMRDRVKAGHMRHKILEGDHGWTAEDLDRMADAWDEWIEAEDGCFGCMHGEIIVTK